MEQWGGPSLTHLLYQSEGNQLLIIIKNKMWEKLLSNLKLSTNLLITPSYIPST